MLSRLSKNVYDCLDYVNLKELYTTCYTVLFDNIGKGYNRWSFENQDKFDEIIDNSNMTQNEKDLSKFYSRGNRIFNPAKVINFIKNSDPRNNSVEYSFALNYNNKFIPVVISKGKYFIVNDLEIKDINKCESAIKAFNLAISNKIIFNESNDKSLIEIMGKQTRNYDTNSIFVLKEGAIIEEYSNLH